MSILTFLVYIVDRIRMGIGMLLPIFADAADLRNWPRWARWGMHLLLLGLVLWGLHWLQPRLPIDENLYVRVSSDWFREFYLCAVFLVLYVTCWVGYALYRLFSADDDVSEFPDLERAWRTAVVDLERANIRLNHLESAPPVFLVVGRTAGGMNNLFRAAGWNFQVRTPQEENARLVVFACYEPYAVFVTVPDATAWTYLCAAMDGDVKYAPPTDSPEAADPSKTLSFDAAGGGALQKFGLSPSEAHELKTLIRIQSQRGLSEAQRDRLDVLAAKGNRAQGGAGQAFTIRTEALRTGERELRFVCNLIRRDRWPLCPVNGVLVLVPWAAGESDAVAQVASSQLAASLTVVRDAFQLHYPTIAAVCDIEQARGFGQFRGAFEPEQLKQRIGQRVPLVPVRTEGALDSAALIRRGIQWIAQAVVPVWVLNALKLEAPAPAPAAGLAPEGPGDQDANRELYLLFREVHRRAPRFASVLSRAPVGKAAPGADGDELAPLPLFGGCYLMGTGNRPFRQAFVTGVFKRMVDDQAAVAWSGQAYADDRRYRRLTLVGYVVIVLAVAAIAATVVLM